MILATVLISGATFLIAAAAVIAASYSGKTETMPNDTVDHPISPESAFYYCIALDNLGTSRGLLLGGVAV